MTKRAKRLQKIRHRLIITPDEEGGFGVEVVELSGCVTYAQNWEDIPAMVREVMQSWIGSALKHDESVPEPQKLTHG